MVGVAQSVRAPDCGSGGRRFDPGRPPCRGRGAERDGGAGLHSRKAVDTPCGFRYCEGLPCFRRSTAARHGALLSRNAACRVPERLRLRGAQPRRCLTIEVMRSGRALPPRSTVSLRFRPVEDDRSRRVKGSTNTDSEQWIQRSTVHSSCSSYSNHGEFDPGSGRTLAACFIHASRTRTGCLHLEPSGGRVSNT